MLNIEVFQDLCRRASIEKGPAELETIKDALRFMLHTEGIEMFRFEKKPCLSQTKSRFWASHRQLCDALLRLFG
jgi:hypothetical protein